MRDILFDFEKNDIIIENSDVVEAELCSQQNGGLIFNKSVVDIMNAALGIGFENIYPNLPSYEFSRIQNRSEKQMMNDGAVIARVKITANAGGTVDTVELNVRYRQEL